MYNALWKTMSRERVRWRKRWGVPQTLLASSCSVIVFFTHDLCTTSMFFLVHNEHKLQEIKHRRLNFPTSSNVWKMTWNAGFLPHFDYLQQAVALKMSEDDMKQLIRHGRVRQSAILSLKNVMKSFRVTILWGISGNWWLEQGIDKVLDRCTNMEN